ncbi:MAG: VWA domain-containing protein [Planctomycetota bacterium]
MLAHPWWLVGLVIVPLLAIRLLARWRRSSVQYSSAASGWRPERTLRSRLVWLPPVLTLLSVTLMIVAIARPRFGRDRTVIRSEGIAIQLVVDRSSSMRALDFKIEDKNVDRLTAIKNVARKFVEGDLGVDAPSGEMAGRASDLMGLISFAGYADAIVPLTLDHTFLVDQLDQTRIVNIRSEDGTAIGDAISLAVDKLTRLEDQSNIESQVIILLTDGENTAGEIEPMQAAELAKTMGVKIYTIGVGTKGEAPFPVRRSRSGTILVQPVQVTIDEETLRKIADTTDGKYFRATDTASLEEIYTEIDQLEKTEVETQRFVDYREWSVQWVRVAGYQMPPLLLVAFVLLIVRMVLECTWLRNLAG